MKHKRESRTNQAEAAVSDVIDALIKADDERFEAVVGGVNRRALLEALVKRLRNEYARGDFMVLSMAFGRLGIRPIANDLVDLALDEGASLEARLTAYDALAASDVSRAAALDRALATDVRMAMVDSRLRELIDLAVESVEQGLAIRVLLETAPSEEVRDATLRRVEAFRIESGAPAFLVYDGALRTPTLASIHAPMLEAVVADGSMAAQALVESLASEPDPPARDLLDGARLRLAEILAGPQPVQQARAQLTVGDVTGFDLHIERRNPNGTLRSVVLSQRNPALIREGGNLLPLIVPHRPESAAIFAEDTLLAEIPVQEAAWLAQSLVGQRDLSNEPILRTALLLALDVASVQTPPSITPAEHLDPDLVDQLLSHDAYDTWVFVPFELSAAGISRPPLAESEWENWMSAAAVALASGPARYELGRRCHYMARWHLARGEAAEAALQTRIAIDMQQDFENSPLVRRLLVRVCLACAEDDGELAANQGESAASPES